MFKKEYSFKGKHADYVDRLTGIIDSESNIKIFNRNIDVYIFAPIVGLVYGKKGNYDNSSNNTTKIFTETLFNEQDALLYNYRLVMLVDQYDKLSIDERLDRAFRYDNDDEKRKPNDELYEQYVLGGVEILYEKIISDKNDIDDILINVYNFINEYNERYNKEVAADNIYELCKLASD